MSLQIDVITLFPDFFTTPLQSSIVGKALQRELAKVEIHDLRPFGLGKHQITDDRPYGGGAGMVMLVEPIDNALQSLGYKKGTETERIILTSAKGHKYTQEVARTYANLQRICLICGHYEGVDERVAQYLIDEEVRIGEYVLTGGEPAGLVMIDSLVRLQAGVLGNEESLIGESHEQPGKLGYAQYSRPAEYKGWSVPEVLLQGHHGEIEKFRQTLTKQEE